MTKIEEVKKILDKWHDKTPNYNLLVAVEICQLKDTECRDRIERIFKEIDKALEQERCPWEQT